MGLKEKKLIDEMERVHHPGMIKWVTSFYGKELPFEADYDSFGDFGAMDDPNRTNTRIFHDFFSALNQALKNSVVKEEFEKQVDKVKFSCTEGEPEVKIADRTLVVNLPYKDEEFKPKNNNYVEWIEGSL